MASTSSPLPTVAERESMADLLGDCRRMARHWSTPAPAATAPKTGPAGLHGITVPAASAHVVDEMAEFGD